MKSALAWFEAFSERGLQVCFCEIGEYDFTPGDCTNKVVVLSHQVCIPTRYWRKIEAFVARGGKLVVDGLSAYYDEHGRCTFRTGFPFEEAFGAVVSEFKLIGEMFALPFGEGSLPGHLWRGTLVPGSALTVAADGDHVYGCLNRYGEGAVLWIPSLVGLACRIGGNYGPLHALIDQELGGLQRVGPLFEKPYPGVFMKSLQTDAGKLLIIVNTSGDDCHLVFRDIPDQARMNVVYRSLQGDGLILKPSETLVLLLS